MDSSRVAPRLSRRRFLAFGSAALAAPWLPADALSAVPTGRRLYGISTFGELKYGPEFTQFDYAHPGAPSGGTFNFAPRDWNWNQSVLTFNTLNSFVARGDAPPRMEMCFDSLMTAALDEPDSYYGLLASDVTISDDWNSFTFRLRPEARWHDGTPVTAEDVAFTFETFRKDGHPTLLLPLSDMKEAVAEDAHTFRLTFNGDQSRHTIFTVLEFPIVSKAFFSANPFDSSQLNAPLGSGPYRVGKYSAGVSIEYERVADYWGRDLPVRRGLDHFETLRIDFYSERQAAFEAFKKGNIDYREEFTSRVWATGYDFPAVEDGRVVKREFPAELRPSMQAWAVNLRRERFADHRVRLAIALCFDFEWTNRNLFYGAYRRSQSNFELSDYKAEGMPSADELALLEPFRGKIPDAAFGEAPELPASDGSGRDRKLLRRASELLKDAGWVRSGQFVGKNGQNLTLEMLVDDEGFVRVDSPFVDNLRAIGVDATIRLVDSAQYQARRTSFDFDMIGAAYSLSPTPTRSSLESMFHSNAADLPGSNNLPGTRDEAVDALIEAAGRAEDRDQLVTALRALDRVQRARRDWIPNWHSASHRSAYWDMFGFDEPKPDYGFPVESLWWYDEEKAKAIGKA